MYQSLTGTTPSEGILRGAGNIADVLGDFFQRRRESKALGETGYDVPTNVRNPKLREALLDQQIASRKGTGTLQQNDERKATLSKYFGENVAELDSALTEGGRTQLSNLALEALLSNQSLETVLQKKMQTNPQEVDQIIPQTAQEESEQAALPKKTQASVSPQGFEFPEIAPPPKSPKALEAFEKDTRKENVPIFKASQQKSKSLKNQEDHLDILEDLSDDIPDLSRFTVNRHGQARPLAQMLGLVPPKAERFIKTVNDFITGAKEIFGSRVTNFDLQTFQSRLPGLLNSKEGRKQIIEQMRIFSEIERNYENALAKVYKHYGLNKIPQEKAAEIAESMVAKQEQELRTRLTEIGHTSFDLQELPNPAQYNGRIVEDENGNRFRSNGQNWEQV